MPEYPRDVARQLILWMREQASLGSEVIETAACLERITTAIHNHSTRYARAAALAVRTEAAKVAREFTISGELSPSKPGGRRWQLAQRIEQIPIPGE